MADLSKATGLSKASLYHHFPGGKQEMATKVLGDEGRRLQKLVLRPLRDKADPASALQASLQGVGEFYGDAVPQCLMNSVMLGSGAALFRQDIEAVVIVWQKLLAEVYGAAGAQDDEAEAWAAYALARIQGALILCRVASNRAALEQCLTELQGDVGLLEQ